MQSEIGIRASAASWRMAAILCLVNAVAFIDRAALPLLVQPIKHDLQITDTEMSLIIGLAFILTYSAGGAVAGFLVDRFSRRKVLASGIALWGISTMFCGMVSNYAALFLGRCAVGAGEATCGPASMSLIKDRFDPGSRGRAVAIWAMGAGFGTGSALLTGGTILNVVGESGRITLPLVGSIAGWQLVLLACGLFALPVAGLVLTIREPARAPSQIKGATLREAWTSVRHHSAILVPLFVANAATIMLATSYSTWLPAFLRRTWEVPAGQIGLIFGLITLTMSTTSQFVGGILVDIVHKRLGLAAVPLVGVAVCAVISVPAMLIPTTSSVFAAWTMIAIFNLLVSSLFTIGTSTVVHLMPPMAVGKISGVHFAWVGITGSAVAPTLVAVMADQVFDGGRGALGQALSACGGALATTGGICLLLVSLRIRKATVKSPGVPNLAGQPG